MAKADTRAGTYIKKYMIHFVHMYTLDLRPRTCKRLESLPMTEKFCVLPDIKKCVDKKLIEDTTNSISKFLETV